MKLTLYQVDAFTDRVFGGNPAAVCVLEEWLDESIMQQIAAENNLAETAFVVPKDGDYEIRWFTPMVEVDLCGHATLATAHVFFEHLNFTESTIRFYTSRSGWLSVENGSEGLTLDFPVDVYHQTDAPDLLEEAMSHEPMEVYRGKTDYLLIYEDQQTIEALEPSMSLLVQSGGRGVIASAPGREVDFVSRFFAPQSGIDEDPVTGSAHTTLTPYWSKRLGKEKLSALQLSQRGGTLTCKNAGDRVYITGKAVTYLIGEIHL